MENQAEQKFNEMYKKVKFYKDFPKFINQEKSNFGKLLLQQNLIFYEIINILHLIELFVNFSILNEFYRNKALKYIQNILIRIPNEKLLFKNYTLGHLSKLLTVFLGTGSKIIKNLEKYINGRNDITHKIFIKYYGNTRGLNEDVERIVKLGKEILRKIKLLNKNLTKDSQFLAMQYYSFKK